MISNAIHSGSLNNSRADFRSLTTLEIFFLEKKNKWAGGVDNWENSLVWEKEGEGFLFWPLQSLVLHFAPSLWLPPQLPLQLSPSIPFSRK